MLQAARMEATRNPINRLAQQAALLTQEAQVHRQAVRPARQAVRPTIRAAQLQMVQPARKAVHKRAAHNLINRPVLQAVHKQAAQPAAHNPVSRPVLKAVRLTPEVAHPALQAQAAQEPFPKTRYHQVQIRALTAAPQWHKLHKNTSAHHTVSVAQRQPDLTAAVLFTMYLTRPANPLAVWMQQDSTATPTE